MAFRLKIGCKQMLKVVRKFIDWGLKQVFFFFVFFCFFFEYGLQIRFFFFFCNLAIGVLSKFPAEHPYPHKI